MSGKENTHGWSTFEYECTNCEKEFQFQEKVVAKRRVRCPSCKKHTLEGIISVAPLAFVEHEPSTVGHLAERNTKKMGKYELQDKRRTDNEGFNRAKKRKKEPWYGTLDSSKVAELTPEQKQKYIMEGKT